MSSGADRFFDEMLETAKKAARKDVTAEQRVIKASLAQTKRDLKEALKGVTSVAGREAAVTRREASVTKREGAIARKCTTAESNLKYREQDIKLAEKEIISLLTQIEDIKKEKVETVYTTAQRYVKRSMGKGWYGRTAPSIKSQSLTAIKRRVAAQTKKDTSDE